ncbi:MAG: hypothetical protein QM578_21685 [Pantoea sp.]|uniref:hypothetical protein n=1 Tax=Pantoea sp. TaxID=69393 RepID=UPI0039E553EB
MDLFKIKNTDSLLRENYRLSDAAEIIGCDVKDIMWYAYKKNIEVCMEFHDDKYEVTSGLSADVSGLDFISSLKYLPRDNDGYLILSEKSQLRINLDEIRYDETGYLICNIKGYFSVDSYYKKLWLKHEGQADEWPEFFIPSDGCNLNFPVKIYVHYNERDDFYLFETLWITKKQIGNFITAVEQDKMPQKKNDYKRQSEVQKNKHAVPRAEVLMAIVSLFHRNMNLRRESPASIAEYLFEHAHQFWPEKGVPPLSYDTIVSLLRTCMKKEGLTFN